LDTEMTDPTTGLKKVVEDLGIDLGTAESAISSLETGKQDDLGITDETTYLLTTKPIQEGVAVETKYQTQTEVENLFPENHPTQLGLIEVDAENVATVIEPYIPTTGTIATFDAPRKYGSILDPRTTITFGDLTEAKEVKIIYYLQSTTIPARIDPDKTIDVLPWVGDAFDGGTTKVNKLIIEMTDEPIPQTRFFRITNEVIDTAGISNDITMAGWWRFEESAPDYDSVFDKTANQNNGTIVPAGAGLITRSVGQVGNCAEATSTSSSARFEIPSNSTLVATSEMTFMAWINLNAANFASSIILASKAANISGEGWSIARNATAGRIRFRLNGSTVYQIDSASFEYNTGDTWMHICFTYDDGVLRGYKDGALVVTDTNASLSIIDNGGALNIAGGTDATVATSGLRTGSKMDNAKYWTRRLSDAEILTEYNKDI